MILNLTDTKLRVKAEFEDEHLGEVKGNNRRPTLLEGQFVSQKSLGQKKPEAKFENGLLTVEVSKIREKRKLHCEY